MNSDAASLPNAAHALLDPSRVQRVLLLRLRSIGDTVLMTPCLAALKSWRPDIEITVASESLAAPLLDNHPLVDRLIITGDTLASRMSAIAQSRGDGFDVAYNMHGGSTAAILARLSGAKRSIGYRGLPLSWLLSDRAPSPDSILRHSNIHSVEQQLALLRWSGVSLLESRPKLSLAVSAVAESRVQERLQQASGSNGYACILPGAALTSKEWSAEKFAGVAEHLNRRWGISSVVVAGPGQEALARQVASASHFEPAVLTGLTLKELVALLSHCRLFVGNDSGPMHIAAALDRPIVAVWGSSNKTVWHPWTGAPYRVVEARGGEGGTGSAGEPAIKGIPLSDVIEAVDDVLESALKANSDTAVAGRARRAEIDSQTA